MTRRNVLVLACAVGITLAGTAPCLAEGPALQGWGIRAGVADDPDQVLGGVQLDFGELASSLLLRPDFQLGFGDDHTILSAAVPVHYRFATDTSFTPYAGGGVVLAFVDRDEIPGSARDDQDFEVGAELVGGLEWTLDGGRAFAVELNLVFGDVHDAEVLAGWTF